MREHNKPPEVTGAPLTLDATRDGPGLANKTIKALREAQRYDEAVQYGEMWLQGHDYDGHVLGALVKTYLELAKIADANQRVYLTRAEELAYEGQKERPKETGWQNLLEQARTKLKALD